ncbi:MAG TPA: TonB-dependent receptor [Opitutaceae bacterium]|nr:TonB-dependent receptor [Opitutaceae bacterium]
MLFTPKSINVTCVLCCAVAALALNPARVSAQTPATANSNTAARGAGVITGQVSNRATGAFLEGARVELGSQSVLTDREGRFVITGVPSGSHRLSVTYTGLDAQSVPVQLAGGERAVADVALTSEIYSLAPFNVSGEREGNALAITQQRNAANVKNILSADAFGNVADQNIGNFLQRVPGISTKGDEGEIYQVQVRGVSADMSSVTIDGTRAANGTNRSDRTRAVEVDKIPADFIETIEVTKALTPDMDADSIGGAVNLKTKSALDRKGRVISFTAGASYNVDRETFRPMGSLMYSDRLGADQKLGVMFTSSFAKTHKPRESVQLEWLQTPDTTQPVWYYINSLGVDELQHTRAGVGLRLDYKLSDAHRVYFNTMYSYFADDLDRHWVRMNGVNASRVRPGWTNTVTETFNHALLTQRNVRDRDTVTMNYQVGGESRFGNGKLDYSANYSHSEGNNVRQLSAHTVAGVGFRLDASRSIQFPDIVQTSGPDVRDPANATLSEVTEIFDKAKDRVQGAEANYRQKLSFELPTSLKAGFRYRGQKRIVDRNESRYTYLGADGVAGRNPATGVNDDNLASFFEAGSSRQLVDGRYTGFPFTDPAKVMAALHSTPQLFVKDGTNTVRTQLVNDTTASEDVYAGYIMGDIRLGRLTLTGGVRTEETNVSALGVVQEITPEEAARRRAWVGVVTVAEQERRTLAEYGNHRRATSKYRDFFPSIHAKFEPIRGLVARASYSTGIGRPNFGDIIPNTTVDNTLLRVSSNNVALKPQYADSYDLSLDYYFEPSGLVSVGAFRKDIRDFIHSVNGGRIPGGANNGFGGQYEGYELSTNANGGHARIRGLEFAYQQQFSFLPGFWRGFGFFGNYTYLQTSGDYGRTGTAVTAGELEDFTPRTANLGLSYIGHRWTIRVKYNYTATRLASFNSLVERRLYWLGYRQTDLNIKYDLTPHFSVFADVINVFDTPTQDQYYYIESRAKRSELFAPAIKFGVSGRF